MAADVKSTLGEDALEQSLVFSMGCHSGLSVSDVLVAGAANDDWAQTLNSMGSLFVGNTGYGYGDTVSVAYTEQLMALFAAQLTEPFDLQPGAGISSSTVGQALAWAKNEYVAGLQTFSVYDEKAVQESTFYGLPFYKVGLETTQLPPRRRSRRPPMRPALPPRRCSSTRRTRSATRVRWAATTPTSTARGSIRRSSPRVGRSSPRSISDVTATLGRRPGSDRARHDLDLRRPAEPGDRHADLRRGGKQPEPEVGDVAFPTTPVQITSATGPTGTRQQLVVATGQYRSDSGQQRLDDSINARVYYATAGETDQTAPTISKVDAEISNGRLNIGVTTSDVGSGVDRVYVLVAQNPGAGTVTWTGVDLTTAGAGVAGAARCQLGAGVTDVEFIVQAKDDAGNVGYATNKARGFDTTPGVVTTPAPPAGVLEATVTGPAGPNGTYSGAVTVAVTSSSPATYFVDDVPIGPVPAGNSFQITGDGLRTWKVTTQTGYVRSGSVLISTVTDAGRDRNRVARRQPRPDGTTRPVTVTWAVDQPGVTAPPPSSVTDEGIRNVVSAPACNVGGLCGSGERRGQGRPDAADDRRHDLRARQRIGLEQPGGDRDVRVRRRTVGRGVLRRARRGR